VVTCVKAGRRDIPVGFLGRIRVTELNFSMSPNFLAVDFETANYYRDSACAIGLVRVEEGKVVEQVSHLIRPPYRNFMFTSIHGITWADVARAEDFGRVWKKVAPLFEGVDFLAAHNASFDKSVLRACCARFEVPMPATPFTCTVKLARERWGIYPTKLPDVARHLGLELRHHEALSDAVACARIVIEAETAPPSGPG
jgi:DNA polymerase III subunit epsilon